MDKIPKALFEDPILKKIVQNDFLYYAFISISIFKRDS